MLTKYYYSDQIKDDGLETSNLIWDWRDKYNALGQMRNAYRILVEIP
jgi:hypothetical protein